MDVARLQASLTALAVAMAAALALGCGPERVSAPPAAESDGSERTAAARSGRHAPEPALGELRLADLTPERVRPEGVETERVVALMHEAFFLPGGFVRASDGDPHACRGGAVLGYALLVNGEPEPRAVVGEAWAVIEAELHCPRLGAHGSEREPEIDTFRIDLNESRPFDAKDGVAGAERVAGLVEAIARRAAQALNGQARMRRASDDEVIDALAADTHPGVLAEAASEAGERRLTAAVDHLARLTGDAEELVAMRAGAALGLLRDGREEVLRALVRLTDGPSEARHLVAIHALGDIGGDAALRYLDNLAVGHPSPALREMARQAAQRARGTTP